MSYTIAEIAQALQAELCGDGSVVVNGAAEPGSAGPDQLAMAMSPRYADDLGRGRARAAMVWFGADWRAMGLDAAIRIRRPRMAMSGLTAMLDRGQRFAPGIHPGAVIDATAELGKDVSVGPFSVIGPGARIGAGSVIGPHCFVGADAVLGEGAFLREMVSIGARVSIGAGFIAQPGARIGADGFSFVTPEDSGVEAARRSMGEQGGADSQSYVRIHSLGAVSIGDNVEIGANSTIDNGTIRDTVIGARTKLDNLVHVGHNTRVGTDCLFCGQSGISGSVEIGDFVVLGGQTGVSDNIFIGDRAITAGGTKVTSNLPAGRVVMGYPAVKMELHTEIYKAQRRLPRLFREVAELKRAVFKGL